VIPSLPEILDRFGVSAVLIPFALAALLTAVALLAPSMARWFEDRNS